MRLCRCGQIVKDKCPTCDQPKQHRKTTKERGYGHEWRKLSERFRAEVPLCQVCEYRGRVTAATQGHHIRKIVQAKHLRLKRNNLLSVCEACHAEVEDNTELAQAAKEASQQEEGG